MIKIKIFKIIFGTLFKILIIGYMKIYVKAPRATIGQQDIIKKDEDRIEKINTIGMFHVFMYFKFYDSFNINNKNLLEKNIRS